MTDEKYESPFLTVANPNNMKSSLVISGPSPDYKQFASVSGEGKVMIDWETTEQAAQITDNIMIKSVAQLMIAIRDGTYTRSVK